MTPELDALIVSLPKLIDLLTRANAAMKQESFQTWMNKLDSTVQGLENAKTDQDYFAAARALAGLSGSLS